MCDIRGIVDHGPAGPERKVRSRMTETLRHRGPDDCGVLSSL
jgi:asparagine synthetase B (glutamine-hydrolysing)